jgi:hypothetical protein
MKLTRTVFQTSIAIGALILTGCTAIPEREPELGADLIPQTTDQRTQNRPSAVVRDQSAVRIPKTGIEQKNTEAGSLRTITNASTSRLPAAKPPAPTAVQTTGGMQNSGVTEPVAELKDLLPPPAVKPPPPEIPAEPVKIMRGGLDVKARDAYGVTPLMRAAEKGELDQVQLQLANGAEINARSEGRQAPLHFGVRGGNPQVVQYLIAHGADIEATTSEGLNPLMLAAYAGNLAVVRVLVEMGADVNAENEMTFSPVEYARRSGNAAVVDYLLQHGAHP